MRNPLLVNCATLLSQQPFLFTHAAPDDVKLAVTISWNLQQIHDLITIKIIIIIIIIIIMMMMMMMMMKIRRQKLKILLL